MYKLKCVQHCNSYNGVFYIYDDVLRKQRTQRISLAISFFSLNDKYRNHT